ncbi:hypothetical protein VNI00_013104 [Paramarasmius palmivorus]|uniref:Flavin-containing monooxygenase n=1 Tax=Paramarasmius palmivorus TaxID=297713 RepID=A0AAW0BZM3_9AGAR
MSGFSLPTLDHLGVQIPLNIDAKYIATEWFTSFATHASSGNVDEILNLFYDESYWRDILALTWDFRTFIGASKIKQFLHDRLATSKLHNFNLREDSNLVFQRPFPDFAWIQFTFDFQVGSVGDALGIGRLIPQSNGSWKCYCMFTHLEGLQNFPERIGAHRKSDPNHGHWTAQRAEELAFEDSEPTVLIIGAGQNGLQAAARLKMLGVENLVVEKNARIGDNWRGRYEGLCLHGPCWVDHFAYLPFPATWPRYSPASKLANWLESYADALDLSVWTSASVDSAVQDTTTKAWTVTIQRTDGTLRVFKNVKHLVFATGLSGGEINMPHYPGMDTFRGEVLHSTSFVRASKFTGKKVVVIGSGTSAHDVAWLCALDGIEVTMYQKSSTFIMTPKNGWDVLLKGSYWEGSPPPDVSDRLSASLPWFLKASGLSQRYRDVIAELDRDLLEGLRARGFKTDNGYLDAGYSLLPYSRAGGYYLDVGASQMIVDGKIKLKSDSLLDCFTERTLRFKDGSEISADVVVFATGYALRNSSLVTSLILDPVLAQTHAVLFEAFVVTLLETGVNGFGDSTRKARLMVLGGIWVFQGCGI